MGTIQTTQAGGTGTFTGNGSAYLGRAARFRYMSATNMCTWTLQARPGGSAAVIVPMGVESQVSFDVAGTYTIRFTDHVPTNTDVDIAVAAQVQLVDYTITNPTTLRTLDVSGGTLTDAKQVLGTLIQDLIDQNTFT